jgi:hypothetical protein
MISSPVTAEKPPRYCVERLIQVKDSLRAVGTSRILTRTAAASGLDHNTSARE